jgi:WD40 repeat protein/uncharacterized caspase-like protein
MRKKRKLNVLVMAAVLAIIVSCVEKKPDAPLAPCAPQTTPPPIIRTQAKSPPPQKISGLPLLRINTPMHTASIRRISTDKDGRWVVSASNDKSIRIWDGVTGEWINTLRLPAEPGSLGKAYAAAISPDGRTIAAGGFTGKYRGGQHIYIFDREKAEMVRCIKGVACAINHLAYSPDGRVLVACLGEKGIRIYRTLDYALVGIDESYEKNSYWADFDRQGRLVTSCADGFVRLYDAQFNLICRYDTKGRDPHGVTFSPDSRLVAVGYNHTCQVDILDGATLAHRYSPDTRGMDNGDLSQVAWSGSRLLAGGKYNDGSKGLVIAWAKLGRGRRTSIPAANDTVMGILPTAGEELLVGTGDPALMRLDPKGSLQWFHGPDKADFRGQIGDKSIRLSVSGNRVCFGAKVRGKCPVGFDLLSLDLNRKMFSGDMVPADVKSLPISNWENHSRPSLAGRALPLDDWERSRSLAIAPDRHSFVLGTEWHLKWFKADGTVITPVVDLPSIAWAVNISPDGKWVVAGLGDGTLRWYDYKTHQEKLALFVQPQDGAWVVWTPEGFFAASPGAEALVGYQLNHGFDKSPEFISGEQIYEAFYRSDLVPAKFWGDQAPIERALDRVGNITGLLTRVRPPKVALADNVPRQSNGSQLKIPLKILDQGSGIGPVEVRVNGVLQPRKNWTTSDSFGITHVLVDLPPDQDSTLEVQASSSSEKGKIDSKPLTFNVRSLQSGPVQRPTLHCLAIGIEDYKDSTLRLNYPEDDVSALQSCLVTYGKELFKQVDNIPPLINAGKADILNAFHASYDVSKEDLFILYLSGHGMAMDGKFYFLPADFIFRDNTSLETSAITQDHLINFVAGIPVSKLVVIIDACNAGAAYQGFSHFLAFNTKGVEDKSAISRFMKTTGRAVFYASGKDKPALEGYKGNSLYTGVMIEGLSGKAAAGDGEVTLSELKVYLDDMVPKVSKKMFGIEVYPMGGIHSDHPIPIARVP